MRALHHCRSHCFRCQNQIENARWHSSIMEQLCKRVADCRNVTGWLPDNGVSPQESRCNLPGGDLSWKIPWGNYPNNTDCFSNLFDVLAGKRRRVGFANWVS